MQHILLIFVNFDLISKFKLVIRFYQAQLLFQNNPGGMVSPQRFYNSMRQFRFSNAKCKHIQ